MKATVDVDKMQRAAEAMVRSQVDKIMQAVGFKAAIIAASIAETSYQQMINELPDRQRAIYEQTKISASGNAIVVEMPDELKHYEKDQPITDMKPIMLNTAGAKTSAAGSKYVDVPMQKKTPSLGSSTGQLVAGGLTALVNKAASALSTGDHIRINKGQRGKSGEMKVGRTGPVTADILTLRRISDNSSPESWIIPARTGNEIIDKLKEVIKASKQAIAERLSK